jgi:hypothetical protein
LNETETPKGWFTRHAEAEAKKDVITFSERAGNIVGVVIGLLAVLYFVLHQQWSTGFFTSEFGTLEMLLFYVSMFFGIISSALRALLSRKNPVRLLEAIGLLFTTVAIAWFFVVFPFDFTFVADVLPGSLRFLLQWISNDVARGLMILGIIITLVMTIYTAAIYTFIRKELSKPTQKTE